MSKKKTESNIDRAFTDSDKHTLSDLGKLQPWTPNRIIVFQSLGGLYPNWGESDREQFAKTGVYAGAAKDVMLFVFLSTLKAEDVDLATWEDAKKFGINRGLHKTNSREFWDAYNKFFEVQREIQISATKPKGSGGGKTDDDAFPNA